MHNRDDNALSLILSDEAATLALGGAVARVLPAEERLIVTLSGDLGAGKTTLVRGLLRQLGYAGKVKSPTYTLVELYAISRLNLYHFDFYRFNQPEEFLDGGLDEYFLGSGICLVEWPDKAGGYLPPADLQISLLLPGASAAEAPGRVAQVTAATELGRSCLSCLTNFLAPIPGATSSNSLPPA